jgi:hypothetical protein
MKLADFLSDDLYRRMAEMEPDEQLLFQEVVNAAIQYVAARLPASEDVREREALETTKQLSACKRRLMQIEKLVSACDSLSPSESKAMLQEVKRVVSRSV